MAIDRNRIARDNLAAQMFSEMKRKRSLSARGWAREDDQRMLGAYHCRHQPV